MYRENPEQSDDRQYFDFNLDRNGGNLESNNQNLNFTDMNKQKLQNMLDERIGQDDAHKLDEYEWIIGLMEKVAYEVECDLGAKNMLLETENHSLKNQLEERNVSIQAIEECEQMKIKIEALIIENKMLKDRLWRMSNSAEEWMNKYKEECKRA